MPYSFMAAKIAAQFDACPSERSSSLMRSSRGRWGCLIWRKRGSRGNLISAQLPDRVWSQAGVRLCSQGITDIMRENGLLLHQLRFNWDFRSHFFTARVTEHWNGLPSEEGGVTGPGGAQGRTACSTRCHGWLTQGAGQ